MNPDTFAALVRFGVWGNAPCQPLMQPVPRSPAPPSPAPFAYQQRYDAGHDNRPPLPFHARPDKPVFGAEGTGSRGGTPLVSPGEPWPHIVPLGAM